MRISCFVIIYRSINVNLILNYCFKSMKTENETENLCFHTVPLCFLTQNNITYLVESCLVHSFAAAAPSPIFSKRATQDRLVTCCTLLRTSKSK